MKPLKTDVIILFFLHAYYDALEPSELSSNLLRMWESRRGKSIMPSSKIASRSFLIECKSISENLDRHDSQLFRYFGTTSAKFEILTNGLVYRFYTDLTTRIRWTPIRS